MPGFADSLEAEVRRDGAHRAADARERWERDRWPLEELDRLARARTTDAFVSELENRLTRLFAAPYERTATVLSGPQLEEARALTTAEGALAELRSVLGGRPADASHVLRVLEQLEVRVGETPQPDRVHVATPEAIRARRFEVVFACGLQEGEFPRGASPEPFLSDEDRRSIASASGLLLPVREDRLDRERYLFYICASRAERLLVLSSRSSDEEGNPQTESYFVDDVRELLEDGAELRTRSLSEVTWRPEDAPTSAEWDRAHAATGPRRPVPQPPPLSAEPLLAELSARDAVAARALENFADCPVKWLVEDLLKPDELVPDPEAMVRGSYAHEVLSHTYRRVHEETGERRVTHGNLAAAERILLEELRDRSTQFQLSPKQTRVRAATRRLEFDLLRFLRSEADSDSRFEPVELERSFGMEGSDPVVLEGGLRVRGRIDRVDEHDGMALVIDYKTGKRVDRYKVASWEPENRFQAALYMLVVEKLLGLRAAGGVYVALGSDDPRPRGMVAKEVDELGERWVQGDRLETEEFQEKLDWALGRIRETDALHAQRRARAHGRIAATGTAAASTPRSAGASGEEADARAAQGGRAPRRLPARAGRRRDGEDNGAGRALRGGGDRGRSGGRTGPGDHVHREGGRRDEKPRAAALPRARPPRGRPRRRERMGLDDPRALRSHSPRACAERRHRPRLPGAGRA